MDTKDDIYPHGVQGTWLRVWELVATIPRIEMESTDFITQLLAPPPPTTPPSAATPPTPITIASFSSEGSNSVAVVAQEDNDDVED